MERIAVAVSQGEPMLLVGETGTGKTTTVQQIARQVGARLVVLNLSQQTDSSDLLGGFRPVQPADAVLPLLDRFADMVRRTWWRGNNDEFLGRCARLAAKKRWGQLVKAFRTAVDKMEASATAAGAASGEAAPAAAAATDDAAADAGGASSKKARKHKGGKKGGSGAGGAVALALRQEWAAFATDVAAAEGGFAFAFVEGALVKAVREGAWLLLDEINLAPAEALERIAGLLEDERGSLVIAERGDATSVPRHPSFRLFAAMNPATDAGKRDLPAPLRNRFAEVWVGEPPQREDLAAIAARFLPGTGPAVDSVVDFYVAAKAEAEATLQDGAGHKPAYNLRTLCRALEYAAAAAPVYGLQRGLWDGFAMSFLTQLDPGSAPRLEALMQAHLLGPGVSPASLMHAPPQAPGPGHVLFDHFWVEAGPRPLPGSGAEDGTGGTFVLTPAVMQHLRNLARAVLLRRYPILLQGPTSSGKTSLVAYLAAQTGHTFVRINNHEQTDLQEYLGSYVSDESGRLVFREGLLVQAARAGHWIVLDELNLAPTEVLEALNRLLDDNRELYVPELQETIKPHPHFMLFATQNPPGIYAGRKTLSRAFRSRFLELHVEDIPDDELGTILEKRCAIAPSYAAKLVTVMRELQRRRAGSNVFAGRHGFITPRDLFRWAGRGAVGYQQLAEDGFAVLGERLRSAEEREMVREVLQKVLNVKLDMEAAYERNGDVPVHQLRASLEAAAQAEALAPTASDAAPSGSAATAASGGSHSVSDVAALQTALGGVVWTQSMRRMYCLLERCLEHAEPALLCGETGTGKTTVCQMAAFVRDQRLHIINCNQHTEVSDFLGGFRPNRRRERALLQVQQCVTSINACPLLGADAPDGQPPLPPPATPSAPDLAAAMAAAKQLLAAARERVGDAADGKQVAVLRRLETDVASLAEAVGAARAPFEWADGPLVQAMKQGDMILVDELNLAEDAVLERLNSVLEPGRSLTLAEKGGAGAELVVAHPAFRLVATMNPGGDYGKKELSPALSNRFTSIWVPAIDSEEELLAILRSKLDMPEQEQAEVAPRLLAFWRYFKAHTAHAARQALSVRDLLAWAHFINAAAPSIGLLPAYAHGAHLVLLDGLGLGVGLTAGASAALRDTCVAFLQSQLPPELHAAAAAAAGAETVEAAPEAPGAAAGEAVAPTAPGTPEHMEEDQLPPGRWGIAPFYVDRCGDGTPSGAVRFSFQAPTTSRNAMRVLRALQLRKPILLEGSPGVGKTSLVAALAGAVGQELVRINLSEQTDMMDLLGADLPVEGGAPGEFAWADGPLLHAIKAGAWVLLDELNLANQTVLEGLNAVLDHRAEVFIPELGATFRCPRSFRVFGAQNPLQEGGGRKGLPKSFLNRFTRVHVELLQPGDLLFIAGVLHPHIPPPTLGRMVAAICQLHHDANVARCFASAGGPWEFNLRDLLRWCELSESAVPVLGGQDAAASSGGGAASEDEAVALERAVQHFAGILFLQRLRTQADRKHAAAIFGAAWGGMPSADEESGAWSARCCPALHVSPQVVQLGWARLERQRSSKQAGSAAPEQLALLPSRLPVLESMAECMARGWMCLLVGPSGAGKTAAVRALATLCGQPLVELSLTSGTDTSDLLGGFEQVEMERKIQELANETEALVAAAAEAVLTCSQGSGSGSAMQQDLDGLLRHAMDAWDACFAANSQQTTSAAPQTPDGQHAQQVQSVRLLLEVLARLEQVAEALGEQAAENSGAGHAQQHKPQERQQEGLLAGVPAVRSAADAVGTTLSDADPACSSAGKFEWVDGVLTRAIERGQWVLLDNANLCNPTVLDRLNPLLEPNGSLFLNECGSGIAGPRIVRPHPGFRLFLALDAAHGEVSRAMRNRGIELFLLGSEGEGSADAQPGRNQAELASTQQQEAESVLGLSGIPGSVLPRAMAATHAAVAAASAARNQQAPSLRELRRWAALTAALARRGWPAEEAFSVAFEQVYGSLGAGGSGHESELAAVTEAFRHHCLVVWERDGLAHDLVLYKSGTWPLPLTAHSIASNSALATLGRDLAILVQHLGRRAASTRLAAAADHSTLALGALDREAAPGLALAATTPAALLQRLLTGSAGSSSALAVPAAVAEVVDELEAAACSLAAAQVYVERASPFHLGSYAAYAVAVVEQLQQASAAGPAASLTSQARELVRLLLCHPLTAALAAVQQQVAASVRPRDVGVRLLPDAEACGCPPPPHLAATQLTQHGSDAGSLWARAQGLAGQVVALQAAVQAAVQLQAALAGAEAAVMADAATLLQLSFWRYQHPKERARRAAPHAAVDCIAPVLQALQALEESLLRPESAAAVPWSAELAAKVAGMQQWRWAFLLAVHGNPEASRPASLALHFESLVFCWMQLGSAAGRVAEAGGVQAWEEAGRWVAAAGQMERALGLEGLAPAKPLLWKRGGRPLLPRTAGLCASYSQLLALCDASWVGGAGFGADYRDQPTALAAAGISVALLEEHQDGGQVPAADRPLVAAAAAAVVASDAQLRSALLEGLCLFVSSAILAAAPDGAALEEMPALLKQRVEERAAAAADAALAVLHTRIEQPATDSMDGPAPAATHGQPHVIPLLPSSLAEGALHQLQHVLPAELMHYPSGRELQLDVLGLSDLLLSSSQLALFSQGGLLGMLLCGLPGSTGNNNSTGAPAHLAVSLQRAAVALVDSGCRSVAEAAPLQLLSWLLDAIAREPRASSDLQRQQLLLQLSLVHEAWFRWHQALWRGAAECLPPSHATAVGPAVAQQWRSLAGPMRLHLAATTVLATGMLADAGTTIGEWAARVLQLRLAARQLRQRCCSKAADEAAVLAAEWSTARLVATSMLAAHASSIPEEASRRQLGQVVQALAGSIALHQDQQAQLLDDLAAAVAASEHPTLRALLQPVLHPVLQALLAGAASGSGSLAACGRAWALLGLMRLHLLVPPAGADPAGKYGMQQQHAITRLRLQLGPELIVRRQFAALPGGADESARIADLEGQAAALQQHIDALEGRCTPRPRPPQYLALREEVARFVASFGDVQRVVGIADALAAGIGGGGAAAAAASTAATWQENASSWVDRLGRQYGEGGGYRDIVQPVQLAVQELRYGLALLQGSAAFTAPSAHASKALAPVVARLLAFPHSSSGLLARAPLSAPETQQAAAEAATAAALQRGQVASSSAGGTSLSLQRAAQSAGAAARLRLLRVALLQAAADLQAAQLASSPATLADVAAAQLQLHSVFSEFVRAWEDIKAEEERRAAEDAELFKTKARSTEIATEEQEDEEDYQRQFPDRHATFADLAGTEGPADFSADPPEAAAPRPQGADQEEQQQAAAYSVRDLAMGEVLQDILAVHATAFVPQATPSCGAEAQPPAAAFLRAYELGVSLLRAGGLVLPAAVDDASATGHLYAACCRLRQLTQRPATAPASATAAPGAGETGQATEGVVDMQAGCIEEAVLVQAPVSALRQRLLELLQEWPEHPLLLQLAAIADRLVSLPVGSPLKAVLTGVELLLARSQLWEETAAKHVSLAPQLGQLGALAARWRRLELLGWRALLDRARAHVAGQATQAWFHLYRILVEGDSPPAEVAQAVEQFVQGSPLGEYEARLDLLAAFQLQLDAMASATATAGPPGAGQGELAARATRWRRLSPVLFNVRRYYAQFVGDVQRQIAAGMAVQEKLLQDFVALAKWEDRGYYALRQSTEKAQRQLHRLWRHAIQLLRDPSSGTLQAAAGAMGFADLRTKLSVPAPTATGPASQHALGRCKRAAKKAAAQAASANAAAASQLADPSAVLAAFSASKQALLAQLEQQPQAGASIIEGGKYASQLPRLSRRFAEVVGGGLASHAAAAGAEAVDELASEVISRALELRGDVAKGAKARKKKALTDFFKALAASGVSRRRSVVPSAQRGVQAWFAQGGPVLDGLLAPADPCAPQQRGSAEQQALLAAAQTVWTKADGYYFRSMARLQRLWEAAKQPHADLSAAEVEASVRSCEHLLWLTQQSRATLGAAADLHAQLAQAEGVLSVLAAGQELPPQRPCQEWYGVQRHQLARLASLARESAELLAAAAEAETLPRFKGGLAQGKQALEAAGATVQACLARLAATAELTLLLPGGGVLLLPSVAQTLEANGLDLWRAWELLQQVPPGSSAQEGLPGWQVVLSAFAEVAQQSAAQGAAVAAGKAQGTAAGRAAAAASPAQQAAGYLESAVAAALVWGQHASKPSAAGEEANGGAALRDAAARDGDEPSAPEPALEASPLPELLQQLEAQLAMDKAAAVCAHVGAALQALAAATDAGGDAADLAVALSGLAPLLGLAREALRGLAIKYLALAKGVAKLCHVTAALLAGLVQEGFCMPDGAEGEGVQDGSDGKMTEGTGLGEGDTKGAKDISNELDDQDQLLGAQQRDAQREEEQQPDEGAQQQDNAGVEMDDDFLGALHDVQPDEGAQSDEGEDGDEEQERLDQQMGEVGEEGEAVDERLWNEDQKEEGKAEEQALADDKPVPVADKSQLEYAAGGDEEEEDNEQQAPSEKQGRQQQQEQAAEGQEEASEEEGEGAEYGDRPEDRAGFTQPEAPEQEFELPEDLNLDGGAEDEGEQQEEGGPEEEQQQQQGEEQQPASAEERAGEVGEDEGGGEDAEMRETGSPGREEEEQQAAEQQEQAGPAAGEAVEGEEEEQPEDGTGPDAAMRDADQHTQEQSQAAEAGDQGLPSAVANAAEQGGAEGKREQQQQQPEVAQPAPAPLETPPEAGASAAGAADGSRQDDAAAAALATAAGQEQQTGQPQQLQHAQANPLRNLGSAIDRWRARLNVGTDAPEQQQQQQQQEQRPETVAEQKEGLDRAEAAEYRFLGEQEQQQAGDAQTLAAATLEQATEAAAQQALAEGQSEGAEEDAAAGGQEEEPGEEAMDLDEQQQPEEEPAREVAAGAANWGAGASRRAGLDAGAVEEQNDNAEGEDGQAQEEQGAEQEERRDTAGGSYVAARLQAATLEELPGDEALPPVLSEEEVEAIRSQLDARLKEASEGRSAAHALLPAEAEAHGRAVWQRCEALTAGLVGELTEQLRLILEPTLASRLAGDYRTGKRINMKKVIGYIASHFRKDKIWLRRTRPDKRRYQVVVAVDDSRSMAETGCGLFALEALTLICRAMSRLEVGELGVVSFGGGGGAVPLHPLERPFTDADGVRIMSQMCFDQDNTISDRPMVDVVTSLDLMLEGAAQRAGSSSSSSGLQQLVLIIADGRFHEKESLRRAVREAAGRPGVLYAFIVLDNPANSILDMQSVRFAGGKPVFDRYLDSFPFPFYIVLGDTAALPRTLADLLRQWFELSAHG